MVTLTLLVAGVEQPMTHGLSQTQQKGGSNQTWHWHGDGGLFGG